MFFFWFFVCLFVCLFVLFVCLFFVFVYLSILCFHLFISRIVLVNVGVRFCFYFHMFLILLFKSNFKLKQNVQN